MFSIEPRSWCWLSLCSTDVPIWLFYSLKKIAELEHIHLELLGPSIFS